MKVDQFNKSWAAITSSIHQIALRYDRLWLKRRSKVDSQLLVFLILKLVLARNAQQRSSNRS